MVGDHRTAGWMGVASRAMGMIFHLLIKYSKLDDRQRRTGPVRLWVESIWPSTSHDV